MTNPKPFFVNPEFDEWMVITETVCEHGGNTYETKASGFATEADAQTHADLLNESAGEPV